MQPQKRFAASDTSFLLALAAGDENCQEVIDWFSRINVYPLATGTVLQELTDTEREDPDPFVRQNAITAQQELNSWGILDVSLMPIDNGIAKIIAAKLVEKKVLPDTNENDGLVVAEAALHSCKIMVTFRQTLLNAPPAGIKFMLIESDVPDLFIVSPENIVLYLRKSEAAATPSS